MQPSGLLSYLDSSDEVPEKETDRLHNRDNVKLASEAFNRNRRNPQWRVIEKQLENVLIHWRARIGMEKKQVALINWDHTNTTSPTQDFLVK